MKRWIKVWLIAGLILLFFQIVIGGITRLTGSGLSITKWEIVTGTFPPMSEASWEAEFDLYKETPQYEKINKEMTMRSFKWIYFWEYVHRLWARMMGFIFIIPYLLFRFKGSLNSFLRQDLHVLVFLTAIVAVFGWIMVASGLVDRPWVNAYKLTWHLSLALIVFGYMAWINLKANFPLLRSTVDLGKIPLLLLVLLSIQIMLGGVMSGAKAGLFFPTWPDMNGDIFPSVLWNPTYWRLESFIDYDKNPFFPAFIQFAHRTMAYIVFITGSLFALRVIRRGSFITKRLGFTLLMLLLCQMVLGILTVVSCVGNIPIALGSLHQVFALFLLIVVLTFIFISSKKIQDHRSYQI